MTKETMKAALKHSVADYRYRHALNTAETAAELAARFHVDADKAWVAGLLHDCAKTSDDPNDYLLMARDAGIVPTQNQTTDPSLFLHAPLSAYIATRKYGIDDTEILNAIRLHHTGALVMTALDKIIYLADWTEPSRKGMDQYRELAKVDLDEAFFQLYSYTILQVIENGWKFFDGVSDIYNALWDERKALKI
jgi:predicted HD superfamily hydrolase involved in NAD metabolism